MPDQAFTRRGKRRFDDDDSPTFARRNRHRIRLRPEDAFDAVDGLPDGDRWSTWDQSSPTDRGPRPYPAWLVTDLAATDTELGILKTGKEADVFLLRRGGARTPTSPACSRPSGTGRRSTGCSTATASTWTAAGSASPGTTARWPAGRAVGTRNDRPAVGQRRVRRAQPAAPGRCAGAVPGAGARAPRSCSSSSASPTARPRRGWPRSARRGDELADLWDQLVQALPRAGRPRPGARRPVGLQPAGAPRPSGPDRPAPGDRRDRASARRRVPGPGRWPTWPLVHRPRPARNERRDARA